MTWLARLDQGGHDINQCAFMKILWRLGEPQRWDDLKDEGKVELWLRIR